MSWRMASKLFNGKRSAHWQVFFYVDGEWSVKNPADMDSDMTFDTRSPYDVLDLEPVSVVQDIEIGGELRTGVLLPESGKFYASQI